jgi:acetyl esterase
MTEQPIDPEILALFDELGPVPDEPVSAGDLTAEELRQSVRETIAIFTRGADPIPVDHVTDESVPGRGGPIPVRIYRPEAPTAVVVYMHGGGWTVCDIETHDLVTRRISRDTGALVVSVDYRMVPEHPFPAAIDDTCDAVAWAAALHPELPLLVAGDSAGGTLAACASLRARDEGGPRIDAQVLIYPGIDDDLDAPSMHAYEHESRISRADLRFFFHQYASPEATKGSPYALPGRATDLSGLPAAVIAIPGHDLLRSSEEEYARRLQEAGVAVTVQLDPEQVHAWTDFAPRVPSADRAFARLTDSMRTLIEQAR